MTLHQRRVLEGLSIISHLRPAAEGQREGASAGLELVAATFVLGLGLLLELQLATLDNSDGLHGAVTTSLLNVLDFIDNVIALENFTEDNVLAIEPRGDDSGNEELRAIGVLASVGHALDMVSLKKFFEINDFKKRVTY